LTGSIIARKCCLYQQPLHLADQPFQQGFLLLKGPIVPLCFLYTSVIRRPPAKQTQRRECAYLVSIVPPAHFAKKQPDSGENNRNNSPHLSSAITRNADF
jgi:hypothetical protein